MDFAKRQIILWDLFCLKTLLQPTETGGDNREESGPGSGPARRVLNIHAAI